MRDEIIFFMDLLPCGEPDENGDPSVQKQMSEMVYAEKMSIRQSEFYQAQTTEFKPEIKFKITDYMDYQGQKYLIHEWVRYTVLRTYKTNRNELEITCYGGVRDVVAAVSDKNL